jgi:hypothetical protein
LVIEVRDDEFVIANDIFQCHKLLSYILQRIVVRCGDVSLKDFIGQARIRYVKRALKVESLVGCMLLHVGEGKTARRHRRDKIGSTTSTSESCAIMFGVCHSRMA